MGGANARPGIGLDADGRLLAEHIGWLASH